MAPRLLCEVPLERVDLIDSLEMDLMAARLTKIKEGLKPEWCYFCKIKGCIFSTSNKQQFEYHCNRIHQNIYWNG